MKKNFTIILAILISLSIHAEILRDPDLNFTLDIPEGFNLTSSDPDRDSYFFTHPEISVNLVLKVYEKENSSSFDILETAMSKLKAKASYDRVLWCENDCTVSDFSMTLDQNYKGWAVSSPLEKENRYIALLAYCPEEAFRNCSQFIISTLNSLSVSEKTSENPGVFVTYAFPKEGKQTVKLNAGGKKITTAFDKSDADANQFVVDLEFGVFTLYASHKYWKEAWQRYYRIVFRDSYGRLSQCAKDIKKALYDDCIEKRPESPETEYLTRLLTWVQSFEYSRDTVTPSKADLTPPVMAVMGKGNDCDSRSLLLCTLMQHAGIDSILLVSKEYRHAMCAFDVSGQGQRFDTDYGSYLMCETTAKVTPGMIAQEHADRSKWIVVD